MMMSDTNELYSFIFRMNKRLETLYKDTDYVEKVIDRIGMEGKNRYARQEQEKAHLKKYLEDVKDSLRKCNSDMIKLSQSLRFAVKKDQLETLSHQTDELEIQDYVTQKDVKQQ